MTRLDVDGVDTLNLVPGDQDLLDQGDAVINPFG